MARKYILVIESNSSHPRTYTVDGCNILAHAQEFGRAEGGETVTLCNMSGKVVTRARWTPEDGGHYYKSAVLPDEPRVQVGSRLAKVRNDAGFTVLELETASGIGHTTISDIEAGRGNPKASTLIALAAALDCEVAAIF